jgi:hypothetical protein
MVFWITTQWLMPILVITSAIWLVFIAAFPDITKNPQYSEKFFLKTIQVVLEITQFIVVYLFWWTMIFSFIFMSPDFIINLIPLILLSLLTLPTIGMIVRKLSLKWIIVYSDIIGVVTFLMLSFEYPQTLDFINWYFYVMIGILLVLLLIQKLIPEDWNRALNKPLIE